MSRHRVIAAILFGSLLGACTSSPQRSLKSPIALSEPPASSIAVSATSGPIPSLKPCVPGAVTRFLPPSPNGADILTGLAAFSGRDAWAVEEQFTGDQGTVVVNRLALVEHWDGPCVGCSIHPEGTARWCFEAR